MVYIFAGSIVAVKSIMKIETTILKALEMYNSHDALRFFLQAFSKQQTSIKLTVLKNGQNENTVWMKMTENKKKEWGNCESGKNVNGIS